MTTETLSDASKAPVVLDTTAPAISLASPMSGSLLQKQMTLSGNCENGIDVVYAFDGSSASQTIPCNSGAFSRNITLSLADGSHVVDVSQTDSSGNKTVRQVSFNVDNTAPSVQITSPAQNGTVTSPNLTISGTCEAGLNVNLNGTALVAPVAVACASGGTFTSAVTVGGTNGAKTITASQTDLAGNTRNIIQNITVNISAGAPAIKIASPAANFLTRTGITLSGTCVTGLQITIAGTGISASKTATCSAGAFSSAITFSSGDGLKNITVAQTNTSGQTGQDARSFLLDATAPAVKFVSPAAGTQAVSSLAVGGSCETGLNVTISGAGVLASKTVACAAAQFSVTVDFSAGIGSKAMTVTQTDAAGNVGTNSRTFERIDPLPANGVQLYANHCAACHMPLASSTKQNRTFSQIKSALGSIAQMQALSLTDPEVQAIAQALVNTQPPPVLTKFEAFKASLSKNCNSCHGNPGSPYPGIVNFAHLQTETDWLSHVPKLIEPSNLSKSPVYARTRFAGSGSLNNMPFVIPGFPDNMTATDAQALSAYIMSLSPTTVPPLGSSPQSPQSALARVKLVVNGEAPTPAEITQTIVGNQLQTAPLKSLIDTWMSSPAGQEKLLGFLRMALQQDDITIEPHELFGKAHGPPPQLPTWLQNLSDSFPRTALDIINTNRPFNEILTTRRIAVTTATLVGLSFADNAAGTAYPVKENAGLLLNFLYNKGQASGPLGASDFTDWRFVNITQASSNTAGMPWNNFSGIRNVQNGANYPLYLPRVGFFNSLAFQLKWLTNEDNQFRVTTNQTLLTALNTTFGAGDPTPHGDLSALDPVHAPTSSACFQCHRLMDPMRDVFKFNYGFAYRANSGPNSGSLQAGAPRKPSFSFWGVQAPLNNMDDFARVISTHPLFAEGWTQKLCAYVNSGPCDKSDPEFTRISQAFRNSNYNFKTLVKELYTSPLVTGAIRGVNGSAPFISFTRGNHLCHALKRRYLQYAGARGVSYVPATLCGATGIGQTAMTAIPEDGTARGTAGLVQSPVITAFSYRGLEVACEEVAKTVVAAGRGFDSTTATQVSQSLTDLVAYIMGLPANHPRHATSVSKVTAVYNNARALSLTNQDAMREAFTFACVSPDVSGVGL